MPPWWKLAFLHGLPLLLVLRLGTLVCFKLHRWSFRRPGLSEAGRLIAANLLASIAFEVLRSTVLVQRPPLSRWCG